LKRISFEHLHKILTDYDPLLYIKWPKNNQYNQFISQKHSNCMVKSKHPHKKFHLTQQEERPLKLKGYYAPVQ